ncbi:cytochrome P450, partial [Streptomyces sp. NPDC003077]|uniref:cytochrome P450 n=1 Tax=Streptomyces sp. NPDC003077 TaxID=3154443 RepID=UPI0033AE7805
HSDTGPARTDTDRMRTDTGPACTDANRTHWDTSPADRDGDRTHSDTGPARTDTDRTHPDTSPARTDTNRTRTDTSPAHRDTGAGPALPSTVPATARPAAPTTLDTDPALTDLTDTGPTLPGTAVPPAGTATAPATDPPDPSIPLFVRRSRACPFDPAEEFARLRAHAPVVRTTLPTGASAWMVTRYADARQVIADERRFSSEAAVNGPVPPPMPPEGFPPPRPGVFYTSGPEEHARIRRMLTAEFNVQRARALVPRVETLADRHLDAIVRGGPPADLIADFALPVPRRLFLELLGIPDEDTGLLHHDLALLHDFHPIHAEQEGAFQRLDAYLGDLVTARRRAPDDSVLGRLITAHGTELTDPELVGITTQLLLAGYATVTGALGLSLLLLVLDPRQAALVREGRAQPEHMAEELLRHLSVVAFGKVFVATEDVTVAGQPIKAGEYVLCHLPSANRDQALGPDLDRLDVTRAPLPHLALGHGPHYCLGAELARMELRVCVPRLLRRLPDLRLTVPVGDLRFTPLNAAYGVESLPVTWSPGRS